MHKFPGYMQKALKSIRKKYSSMSESHECPQTDFPGYVFCYWSISYCVQAKKLIHHTTVIGASSLFLSAPVLGPIASHNE